MPRPSKYSPELRERAVRMVFDHAHEYASQWATMRSVADKLGCTTERSVGGCAKPSVIAARVRA
jgi:transposase-like protein